MEGLRFKFIRPTFRTTPNLCSRNCRTGPGNGQARLPGNGIVEGEDRNQSPVPEERYWHRRVNRERRARHLKTLLGTWGPIHITQTGTPMVRASTKRKKPQRERAFELPKGGFEHPFQDSVWNLSPRQGKEHPRTVSRGISLSPVLLSAVFPYHFVRSSSCGCVRCLIGSGNNQIGGRA